MVAIGFGICFDVKFGHDKFLLNVIIWADISNSAYLPDSSVVDTTLCIDIVLNTTDKNGIFHGLRVPFIKLQYLCHVKLLK
jgi:hypothetical protein